MGNHFSFSKFIASRHQKIRIPSVETISAIAPNAAEIIVYILIDVESQQRVDTMIHPFQ